MAYEIAKKDSSSTVLTVTRSIIICILFGMFSWSGGAGAQTIFTLSLDTSTLIGNANGPFSLDFQLNDGSGTNDGNNMATLSHFNFGTGSPTGAATTSGGATGDLSSNVTLTDNSFFNELFQSFTPGSTLKFDVSLTGNADAGPTPDEFSFGILDNTLSEIPTTGAASAFLIADITPQGIALQTFAGMDPYAGIAAPSITTAATTPESGPLPMLGAGLVATGLLLRYRKR